MASINKNDFGTGVVLEWKSPVLKIRMDNIQDIVLYSRESNDRDAYMEIIAQGQTYALHQNGLLELNESDKARIHLSQEMFDSLIRELEDVMTGNQHNQIQKFKDLNFR